MRLYNTKTPYKQTIHVKTIMGPRMKIVLNFHHLLNLFQQRLTTLQIQEKLEIEERALKSIIFMYYHHSVPCLFLYNLGIQRHTFS